MSKTEFYCAECSHEDSRSGMCPVCRNSYLEPLEAGEAIPKQSHNDPFVLGDDLAKPKEEYQSFSYNNLDPQEEGEI